MFTHRLEIGKQMEIMQQQNQMLANKITEVKEGIAASKRAQHNARLEAIRAGGTSAASGYGASAYNQNNPFTTGGRSSSPHKSRNRKDALQSALRAAAKHAPNAH